MVRALRFAPIYTLFLSLVALPAIAEEAITDIVKRAKPAVVTVVAYDSTGEVLRQGSGFFIDQDHVITNWHVIEGASRAEVKAMDGKNYKIKEIAAADEVADLASLKLTTPNLTVTPLSVTRTVPQEGERVIVLGSPMGLEFSVSDGIVSAVRDIPDFGRVIQISAPVSPGSSGSPVLNLKGEVIGVAVMQSVKGQNLNFAVPGEQVLSLKTHGGKSWQSAPAGVAAGPSAGSRDPVAAGLKLFKAGSFKEALQYFSRAAKDNPRDHIAWFLVGACYFKMDRYEQAITGFQNAATAKPDFIEAHLSLGNLFALMERYDEAVNSFRAAIKLSPNHAEAHYGLGLVYLASGQRNSAMGEYNELLRLDQKLAGKLLGMIVSNAK